MGDGDRLAPYVTSVVGYDVCGEPGVHIGMPSTSLTLVLAYDEPLDVGWAGGPRTRATSVVAGLHTAPAAIHHGTRQAGIQLALSPLGARLLLGAPAATLRGQIVELGDLDPALRDLPDRVTDRPVAERARLVADVLRAALARRDGAGPRAEVGRCLALLTRGARVAEVADEVGFSRRRLQDVVRAEVGVTPKEWARLARFERSHRMLTTKAGDLAGIAATCGYADQAHLAREWRSLAGVPPTEWLRREFPNLQAGARGDGARWTS